MSSDEFNDEPAAGGSTELPQGVSEILSRKERLRSSVLRSTSAYVVRRRRLRRSATVLAVAVAYLGGIGSARYWQADKPMERAASNPVETGTVVQKSVTADTQVAEAASPRELTQDILGKPDRLAAILANAPLRERVTLLRDAGDRYLNEFNDVSLALKCYRRYLDLASPEEKNVTWDETWLLRSLKQARTTEVSHAAPQT